MVAAAFPSTPRGSGRPHRAAAAGLPGAGVHGTGTEHVVAGSIPLHEPDLERPAGRPGRPPAGEHEVPVVSNPDAPEVARSVLVDLVLDLDPAVLLAELDLPVAATAAHSSADDVAIFRQHRRRRSDQQDRRERRNHRSESHRCLLHPWAPIGALEVNDAGGPLKEAETPGQVWDKTRTSVRSEDRGKKRP